MATSSVPVEDGTPELNHTNGTASKYEEIQNFVKCHKAIQEVCLRAASCVQAVLEVWHGRMLRGSSGLKECQHPRRCDKIKGRPKKASCRNCQDWAAEIEDEVFPQTDEVIGGLRWTNTKPSKFQQSALEVAKVFVYNAPVERMSTVTEFIKFDGGSLLMLMKTFSEFMEDSHQRSHKKERGNDTASVFTIESSESSANSSVTDQAEEKRKMEYANTIDKVLTIRNKLCHIDVGCNLQIPDEDVNCYFTDITRLIFMMEKLGHFSRTETGNLHTKISEIRKSVTTQMIDETKHELQQFVPSEALNSMDEQLNDLKKYITVVQVQTGNVRNLTIKKVDKEVHNHYHIGPNGNGLCMLKDAQRRGVDEEKIQEGLNAFGNIPYNKVKRKIKKELSHDDLDEIKALLEKDPELGFGIDKSRIEKIEKVNDLLKCLEDHRLLGPYNLVFFAILLTYVEREDLKVHFDRLAEHMRNESKLNPLTLCSVGKSADGMFLTELKIQGNPEYLHGYQIDDFRKRLASQLLIPQHHVRFEAAGNGCFIIVFQLPEKVRNKVRSAAIERAHWLIEAKVIGVHIEDEDYITLVEKSDDDLYDENPEHHDDDKNETLSHVTSNLENADEETEKINATLSESEQQIQQQNDPISQIHKDEDTGGANADLNEPLDFEQDTIHQIKGIFDRIERLEPYDARFPAPVPALKQYIRKLQEDMTAVAKTFKKKGIESLKELNMDKTRGFLFGSLNMASRAIQLSSRFGLNSGLVKKLLLERAECALILAYYTFSDEEKVAFYDVAKINADEVLARDKDNESAKVLRLLLGFIPISDEEKRERGLCSLFKRVKSRLTEQQQHRSAIRTASKIMKELISPEKWQECTKPSATPLGSDSGKGSSQATFFNDVHAHSDRGKSSISNAKPFTISTGSDSGKGSSLTTASNDMYSDRGKSSAFDTSSGSVGMPKSKAPKNKTKTNQMPNQSNIEATTHKEKIEFRQQQQPKMRTPSTTTLHSRSETDLESEISYTIASDSGSENLNCEYCDQFFHDAEEKEQHSASLVHKSKLVSMEPTSDCKYRPPPPNVVDGDYELCESISGQKNINIRKRAVRQLQTTCIFSDTCSKAHSQEELEEWQNWYKRQNKKMSDVVKRNLHSRMDDLRVEYKLSDEDTVLTKTEPQGVQVSCSEQLEPVIIVSSKDDHKPQTFTWNFIVETCHEKSLQSVGLLDDEDRLNFHLIGTGKTPNTQLFTKKQVHAIENTNSNGKSYHITVSFSSKMLGDYKQHIVFDFGENPKFLKKIQIQIRAREKTEHIQPDLSHDHILDWSHLKCVPFRERAHKSYHQQQPILEGVLEEELNKGNYRKYMHTMLQLEEEHRRTLLKRFGIKTEIKIGKTISITPLKFCTSECGCLFGEIDLSSVPLDDSPASQIVLNNVEFVMIKFENSNVIYEASIYNNRYIDEKKTPDKLYVVLSQPCVQSMNLSDGENRLVQIQFEFEGQLFQTMHKAVDQMENLDLLFPPQNPNPALISPRTSSSGVLNKWQECAARFIRNGGGNDDTTPLLLLYGPFGSGKTFTLARTALQILKDNKPNPRLPRVLICTHSNSAADIYVTDHFAKFTKENNAKIKVCRVYATSHDKRSIPDRVKPYSNLDHNGQLTIIPKDISKCQLVITTTSTAARLPIDKFRDFFTHILIDEAGQVLETEAIIPLTLATSSTCVILAGDHRQMGPKVYSREAVAGKFHYSLLQRLMEYSWKHDCRRYILLTRNYRTNKEILTFLSKTFYTERPFISAKSQPKHPENYPLEFHAVMGEDISTGSSFINDCEAEEVCKRVESLIEKWPACWGPLELKDIGIFSPYTLQVRRIRKLLRMKKLEDVTVERVQNVQGKQYRVVIISTVRSHRTLKLDTSEGASDPLSDDYLGVLSDWRQLNTAFTRAQSLLVVVGNPKTLCFVGRCCIVWTRYLEECRKKHSLYPNDLSLDDIRVQSQNMCSPKEMVAAPKTEISKKLFTRQLSDTWAGEASQNEEKTPSKQQEFTIDEVNFEELDEGKKKDVILKWLNDQLEGDYLSNDSEFATITVEDGDRVSFVKELKVKESQPNIAQKRMCIFRVDFDRQLYAVPIQYPKGSKKILISTNTQRNTALDGDHVEVAVFSNARGGEEQEYGKVLKVIKRAVNMEGKKFPCFPDPFSDNLMVPFDQSLPKIIIRTPPKHEKTNRKMGGLLSVPIYKLQNQEEDQYHQTSNSPSFVFYENVEVTNKERPNKLFLVQWLKWDEHHYYPIGMVVDCLPLGDNLQDGLAILKLAYSVPPDLDEEPLTRDWKIPSREIGNRHDFRKEIIFTIDPDNAQDFDDALSIKLNSDGSYDVGIHIADVSYFIPKGSDTDEMARDRATSFYPYNSRPIHMLPPVLSTWLCSLIEHEDRLAVSLSILFDKNGNLKQENRPMAKRFKRSVINCNRNLRYSDVQKVIFSSTGNDEVFDSVVQLYKLASNHRQQRLGLRRYTEHGDHKTMAYPQAHILVEELMIIANHLVAKNLMELFPQCTPLRRQQLPHRLQFLDWKKTNEDVIKYSLFLESQEKWIFSATAEVSDNESSTKRHETVKLIQYIWDEVKERARTTKMEDLASMICADSKHPEHASVLRTLHHIMPKSEYVNSGDYQMYDVAHTDLRLDVYTHFTSPIRRYLDIVVHRLLLSALSNQKDAPHKEDEIRHICHHCSIRYTKAREFESKTYSLQLASEVQLSPLKLLSFIESVSEDDMMLGFSLYPSVLSAHQRSDVGFNLLKPIRKPYLSERGLVSLGWKERIYHVNMKSGISREVLEENQNKMEKLLKTGRFIVQIPGHQWMKLLKNVKKNNVSGLRQTIAEIDKELNRPKKQEQNTDRQRRRTQQLSGGMFPVVSEVVCMADAFVNFKRSFAPGDVLQVQLQTGLKRGILSPRVALVNITPMLEFCIEHRRNPVGSFAEIIDEKLNRNNIQSYKDTLIPILEMDSAYRAVQTNDTIIIHGVQIEWLHRNEDLHPCGSFSLSDSFCKLRHIRFYSDEGSRLRQYFLCIRYKLCEETITFGYEQYLDDQSSLIPKENKEGMTFVAHAYVVDVNKPDTDDPRDDPSDIPKKQWTVFFEVHQCLSTFPIELMKTSGDAAPTCTIEIIQKALPDRRLEEAVDRLQSCPCLIQDICLHQQNTDSNPDDELNILAGEIQFSSEVQGSPFPKLNEPQRNAIHRSLHQRFTVIQGPPGTGKTVTGAYMVYFLTQVNNILKVKQPRQKYPQLGKPQVLYCGPSNKSVDVITGYLRRFKESLDEAGVRHNLSFVRVYSEGIEAQRYPINGMIGPLGKQSPQYDIDQDVEMDSLHVKIRKNGDQRAQDILEFEEIFGTRNRRKPTYEQYEEYKAAIKKAQEMEIKKYSVVLSTCNTAGSKLIGKFTNVIECIVDEAGMCCEPETLIPLVATKPKRVVLIGDHKQLRPIIQEQTAKQLGLDIPLLELYSDQKEMLTIQYRMHKSICEFPSREFYDNNLITGRSSVCEEYRDMLRLWPGGEHQPTVFCHIEGHEETISVQTEEGNEKSKYNEQEVNQVVRIVNTLVKQYQVKQEKIAVLTQYRQQYNKIATALSQRKLPKVATSTVIKSQGAEWDFVVLSTVRTLPWWRIEERPTRGWRKVNLGFITDENQMNVALTRAREGLIIVGNMNLLEKDKHWKNLLDYYRKKGCVLRAREFLPHKK